MENKAHALAAGAFVLVVTALLVALAVWLGRDSTNRQIFELSPGEAVSGLQPQAAVRFKGVAVGKVIDIGFDPKVRGHVLVRIAVDNSAPVTTSTYATLGFQGVTGLAFVQLDDSGESTTPLRSTDGEPPRIPMRPGMVGRLSEQGTQLLQQLEETTRRMNQLLVPENQKAVLAAVASADQAAQSVRQLAGNVDTLLRTQLDPQRVNLPLLVQEARQTVAEVGRAAQRLNEKGGVVDKLGAGGEALSHSAATLNASTLPRVHRVGDDAARTLQQVRRTVSKLDENPQVLFFGAGPLPPGPGEPGFVAPAPAR